MNAEELRAMERRVSLFRERERLTLDEAAYFLLIRTEGHYEDALAHVVEAVELGKLPTIIRPMPTPGLVGQVDPSTTMVSPADVDAWVGMITGAYDYENVPGLEEFLLAETEEQRDAVRKKYSATSETESPEEVSAKMESDASPEKRSPDPDEELAALFDPVGTSALEKMFPAENWKRWAERAKRNGLARARDARGRFNPYYAAKWWLENQNPEGWDWAHCRRRLANNLPPRSRDSAYLLTDELD